MHQRCIDEFPDIKRGEALLAAVVSSQVARADAITFGLEIETLSAQLALAESGSRV